MTQTEALKLAHDIGAKGAKPTEEERLLFEAWMRGHCWQVVGKWDGATYKHPLETTGFLDGGAMGTRRLWAAWRDRAALASTPPQRTWAGLTDEDVMSITFNFDVSSLSLVAKAVEAKLKEKNT